MINLFLNMLHVRRSAAGDLAPAIILVQGLVMPIKIAGPAVHSARFAAHIPNVLFSAMRHAPHVLRSVPGLANTEVAVICLVPLHVTVFPAISAAPRI
ncbi:hypothetical protein ABVK25_006113 [Lepraria finkii]|uniref:Uncharacterized protein n=1 Tax=Lepraria finkii TaxID=1340010 RepID=A0ABR4B7U8_9LECA